MKIVQFSNTDTTAALGVLDDLRRRVAEGSVVAFAAVGIEADDTTRGWTSCTRHVSRLRMMGAIASMEQSYHHDPKFGG